ncbi:hypothetical protein BY458DRAFT_499876 [Sporodiniella umbellata]|nr:hypothetical protein BY458DRAFT_499876 [Sporodiniella umbellata]
MIKTLYAFFAIFSVCLAKHQLRSPPFGVIEKGDLQHLGDYTHSHETVTKPTYSCKPTGACEICSSFEKKTFDFCAKFGNIQPVQCEWKDPDLDDRKNQTVIYDDDSISLPFFQPCAKVKRVERSRFIKFEVFNLFIAVLSIVVLTWRQKLMANEQYQKLAKRIGIIV